MALRPGHGLDGWELAVAKKLVGEFRRRSHALERQEFDDLVQDCLLHWIGVRRKVDADPRNPPVAYMAQVLRNRLADWVREQGADKCGGDLELASLDAPVRDLEDGMTLAESLDAAGALLAGHDGDWGPDARIDLLRVLPDLTPSQRRLCLLLGEEGVSVKQAAERLGIPRATLYAEIHRIRQVFVEHSLDNYLKG